MDRLDRRRVIVLVNLVRAAVIGGLALAVATGVATVALVYAAPHPLLADGRTRAS